MVAAVGRIGLSGALLCAFREIPVFLCASEAIWAILRSVYDVLESCPKETAWNESGILAFGSLVTLRSKLTVEGNDPFTTHSTATDIVDRLVVRIAFTIR